jgi:hypothetical protein
MEANVNKQFSVSASSNALFILLGLSSSPIAYSGQLLRQPYISMMSECKFLWPKLYRVYTVCSQTPRVVCDAGDWDGVTRMRRTQYAAKYSYSTMILWHRYQALLPVRNSDHCHSQPRDEK